MKYVFFGTPRFAEIVLSGLLDADMVPIALVCNPDRPIGRKKIITTPATKQLVATHDSSVQILQPEKLDDAFIAQLKNLAPDFFIVAAYAQIIPAAVLAIPRLGTLGTHPSLLPQYRGASPIQSALLDGEEETGATIYKMDEKTDHGAIYAQATVPLDALETNYLALEKQLAELSASLLISTIPKLLDGTLTSDLQDESAATFTNKFKTEDGFVEVTTLDAAIGGDIEQAEKILRMIHALNPEPGCWTVRDGKRIRLLEARIHDNALKLLVSQEEGQKPKQH